MADGINFKLEGFEEINKKLAEFTDPASLRRISTRATRAGLKDTRKEARANAKRLDDPKTPRKIYKNITTKINSKSFRSDGTIKGSVGVKGGAKKGGGDTYYWRFLEFGTSKTPARPFLRPAMRPDEMTDAFKKAMWESIAKEIQKYGAPT